MRACGQPKNRGVKVRLHRSLIGRFGRKTGHDPTLLRPCTHNLNSGKTRSPRDKVCSDSVNTLGRIVRGTLQFQTLLSPLQLECSLRQGKFSAGLRPPYHEVGALPQTTAEDYGNPVQTRRAPVVSEEVDCSHAQLQTTSLHSLETRVHPTLVGIRTGTRTLRGCSQRVFRGPHLDPLQESPRCIPPKQKPRAGRR